MHARRHRGFRLGRKLLGLWRWALCHRRRRRGRGYIRLQPCPPGGSSPLLARSGSAKKLPHQQQQIVVHQRGEAPGMLKWGRSLARRMRLLRRRGSGGDGRILEDAPGEATTPKGQVAVYVGGGEPGESMRYVVPVVYFNHPLFGELLREAEEEFGFAHPGGITIPCAAARFERAAAVAAAGGGGRKAPAWW
ncbi:auxin-responsive protein SAUR36-like [Oryza brachyantha]|uniref:auxin-responsive protein SAUR36-like n=1 Tax=Oryza brachyantha TaxID=4533 RepID=UPI001ADB32B0|nr:auxin-responsive protein SAUR36-like [Oryza brachyantha]